MVDINKVTIRGRAAASAEWKDLPNTTLVTLRVATSDDYTDRDGRKVERTDWHMVACWGQMADQARGIRKGDAVSVEGKLRTGRAQVWWSGQLERSCILSHPMQS